jgi:hypothetical protein
MLVYQLDHIAHAILNGKFDIIVALRSIGLAVDDSADEELVFKLILENQDRDEVNKGIGKVLSVHQYHQHCTHCIEAIQTVYQKGLEINRSIKNNTPS